MKSIDNIKCVLLFSACFLIAGFAQAQEYQYIPFPTSNAVWGEIYSGSNESSYYNKFALFDEDTVINNITYHKLFYASASEISKENSVCIGGIREDSLKTIWFYSIENTSDYDLMKGLSREIKLFDFGVEVGDTLYDINYIAGFTTLFVSGIDTIKINKTYRKVFSFKSYPFFKWIEGVGSTTGLLFPSGIFSGSFRNELLCMHQNDVLQYKNPDYNVCVPSYVLSANDILPNNEMKVYPNPVTGGFVYFENTGFETLELFDAKACVLKTIDICGIDCVTLDLSGYSKGIYTYKLSAHGSFSTEGKLLVK